MTALRIDAHQHFWALQRADYGWLTPDMTALYRDFLPADLAPELAAGGIRSTVVVQAAPTVAETRYLLDLAHQTESIAAVVGWVDMASSGAPEEIAALAVDRYLVGIRPMIQDLPDPDWMLQPQLAPAFEALIEQRLRFDALVKPAHLNPLLKTIARYPDLPVVIDHGAKPDIANRSFDAWAAGMARLGQTGVYCKLSGLLTEASPGATVDDLRPYVDHLLECFGPDRLMWGSDWPVLTLAATYGDWLTITDALLAGLSEAERSQILGGTAAKFYGLELG